MTSQKTVGIIGLGNMGRGMAACFVEKGATVTGFDVAEPCRKIASDFGVQLASDVQAVFSVEEIVILSLPTSKDVEEVLQVLMSQKNAATKIVIDTSTADPASTRKLAAQMAELGLSLVDAPVSGGPIGSRAGTLGMLVGGDEAALEKAKPILSLITSKIVYLGASGCGNVAKLLHNLMGAAHLVLTSEIVRLGTEQGLAPEKVIAAISAGNAKNNVTETNYPKWIFSEAFDSGFTMKLMRKDVRLAAEFLETTQGNMLLTAAIAGIYEESTTSLADEEDFNRIVQFHPLPV